MKIQISKILIAVAALALATLGCGATGGSEDDASVACEDFCEEASSCDIEFLGEVECDVVCEDVDDYEDDLSGACEEAVADVFDCVAAQGCGDLEEFAQIVEMILDAGDDDDLEDLIEEAAEDFLEIFDECTDELRDLDRDCSDDIEDILDDLDDDFDDDLFD